MVGSFEVAAFRRLLDPASVRESDVDAARPWALDHPSEAAMVPLLGIAHILETQTRPRSTA
jgi:hypothetical protein